MISPLRALVSIGVASVLAPFATGGELPKVAKVELQPLAAQVQRVADALDLVGSPLRQRTIPHDHGNV